MTPPNGLSQDELLMLHSLCTVAEANVHRDVLEPGLLNIALEMGLVTMDLHTVRRTNLPLPGIPCNEQTSAKLNQGVAPSQKLAQKAGSVSVAMSDLFSALSAADNELETLVARLEHVLRGGKKQADELTCDAVDKWKSSHKTATADGTSTLANGLHASTERVGILRIRLAAVNATLDV